MGPDVTDWASFGRVYSVLTVFFNVSLPRATLALAHAVWPHLPDLTGSGWLYARSKGAGEGACFSSYDREPIAQVYR